MKGNFRSAGGGLVGEDTNKGMGKRGLRTGEIKARWL